MALLFSHAMQFNSSNVDFDFLHRKARSPELPTAVGKASPPAADLLAVAVKVTWH